MGIEISGRKIIQFAEKLIFFVVRVWQMVKEMSLAFSNQINIQANI